MSKSDTISQQSLILPPALDDLSLPSLSAWLQRCGPSVQILAAYCGNHRLEAALSKLQPPRTQLVDIYLPGCSDAAVQLVAGLTALTCCELQARNRSEALDLSPLTMLPTLQKLQLTRGALRCAGMPAHLTHLTFISADLAVSGLLPGGNDCVTLVPSCRSCMVILLDCILME